MRGGKHPPIQDQPSPPPPPCLVHHLCYSRGGGGVVRRALHSACAFLPYIYVCGVVCCHTYHSRIVLVVPVDTYKVSIYLYSGRQVDSNFALYCIRFRVILTSLFNILYRKQSVYLSTTSVSRVRGSVYHHLTWTKPNKHALIYCPHKCIDKRKTVCYDLDSDQNGTAKRNKSAIRQPPAPMTNGHYPTH